MVGQLRIRVAAMVCSARFRARSPPRLSRCRTVRPLLAGSGLAPPALPASPGVPPAATAGTVIFPGNDAAAVRDAVVERTAAVMLEPIQGETGVHVIGEDVIAAAREACDE